MYSSFFLTLCLCFSFEVLSQKTQNTSNSINNRDNKATLLKNQYTSQYKGNRYQDSGPIRFKLVTTQAVDRYQSWDRDFYKRHLILREVKKGFTSYMYILESQILEMGGRCSIDFGNQYIYVQINTIDIAANQPYSFSQNLRDLQLEFAIHSQRFPVQRFSTISFERNNHKKYRLTIQHREKLRNYGRYLAKVFFANVDNQAWLKTTLVKENECANQAIDNTFKKLN